MVLVKVYPAGSNRYCPEMGRHGVVHRETCSYARDADESGDWHQSDSRERADRDFHNRTLFWCSRCYPGDVERHVPACLRAR